MAYISVSRAQFDVKMYTNDAKTLGQELNRNMRKQRRSRTFKDPGMKTLDSASRLSLQT